MWLLLLRRRRLRLLRRFVDYLPAPLDSTVKQTAELFVGVVRADRRAGGLRAQRVHNCWTELPHEVGLRGGEFVDELLT